MLYFDVVRCDEVGGGECVRCSHFETVADDVLDIYKRINGHKLDLTLPKEE